MKIDTTWLLISFPFSFSTPDGRFETAHFTLHTLLPHLILSREQYGAGRIPWEICERALSTYLLKDEGVLMAVCIWRIEGGGWTRLIH